MTNVKMREWIENAVEEHGSLAEFLKAEDVKFKSHTQKTAKKITP